MKKILIDKASSLQRVDKYVKKYLSDAPLSFIYKLFRKKDVKINGHWVKGDYVVQEGDELSIYVTDTQLEEFNKPKEVSLTSFPKEIIYEDDNVIIVNKPKGLLVHGDKNEKTHTLANQVLSYLINKGEYNPRINDTFTPAPAHRLDRNTSGLVVFGKNINSLQILEDLFKDKNNIEKHYYALVCGQVVKGGSIDKPLKKDANNGLVRICPISEGGKSAKTLYTPVSITSDYTLLDIVIVSGRTHQIRVHMASLGYHVVGDGKYGNFLTNREFNKLFNYDSQFLHAYKLIFKNIKGNLSYLSNKEFVAPIGEKEQNILLTLGIKKF